VGVRNGYWQPEVHRTVIWYYF